MTCPYHAGELAVQAMAGESAMAERNGAAIADKVMGGALPFLRRQSMVVIAYANRENRIWTSLLFGMPGFLESEDGHSPS